MENEFIVREGLLLKDYFFLKRFGQSEQRAFGLDKSDVIVEYSPLVYHPTNNISLTKVDKYKPAEPQEI
jgi:KUP system potassium uptake protein